MTLTEKDRERKNKGGLLTCMYATKLCTINFHMAIGSAAATAVMQHHLKILSLLCDLSSALGPYCVLVQSDCFSQVQSHTVESGF